MNKFIVSTSSIPRKASEEVEKRNPYCGQLNLAFESLMVGAGAIGVGFTSLKGGLYAYGYSSITQ